MSVAADIDSCLFFEWLYKAYGWLAMTFFLQLNLDEIKILHEVGPSLIGLLHCQWFTQKYIAFLSLTRQCMCSPSRNSQEFIIFSDAAFNKEFT